jgi:hypothetical protein
MRIRSFHALKQSLKKNSKKWKKLLDGKVVILRIISPPILKIKIP